MPIGPDEPGSIDLGNGVYMRWLGFHPDRDLNPHLAHLADEDKTGIIVGHVHPDGAPCEGAVLFDTPANRHRNEDAHRPLWQVHSLDPLHIEPSILYTPEKGGCGLHGFIREGRWQPA
jgi:hypothetical protein